MKIYIIGEIYRIIGMVIYILQIAIVIRALLSWIPHSPSNQLIRIIYEITEPLLRPFRRIRIGGPAMMIDFSPILAIFALSIISTVILPLIYKIILSILF